MEKTLPPRVNGGSRNLSKWLTAIVVVIAFSLPSFNISRNCSNFCRARCKRDISWFPSIFVQAAPVEQLPKSVRKKDYKNSDEKSNRDKVECLIDETKGFKNAANIYQCASRQTCCFEYAKPSCCGSKPTVQIIQEQITLWGGLLAILALISAIVFCRRKDFSLDFTKLLSFGCCCSSPTEKGLHEKNEDRSVQVTKQSFLKKCNKVGTLDTYSNAPVTVNKLKDCVDQKNTNENSFFIKQHLVIDERNVQSLGKHKQLSQPQSMLARVQ